MWGTYVHMYTKYEFSTYNSVPGGVCAQMPMLTPMHDDADTTNDRQSMIVQGPLVDKPNEPKT